MTLKQMRKLLFAAVLMLVVGDNAIADEQAPAPAPIPVPPVAQSPAPQCYGFSELSAEAQIRLRRTLSSACSEDGPHKSPAKSSVENMFKRLIMPQGDFELLGVQCGDGSCL